VNSFAVLAIVFINVALLGFACFVFWFTFRAMRTVPWIRTRRFIRKTLLELADVQPGEVVVDLGSGDGSIVLTAAQEFQHKVWESNNFVF